MQGKRQKTKASRARVLAYECLFQIQERDAYADNLIDKIIDKGHLDPKDKAFATRLVLGVVSMRGSLDEILNMCMRKPTDVKNDVRCALRISAYEMIYLDKDSYASVSQGVELVKEIAPRAGGLANSVLRKVADLKKTFPFADPRSDIKAYSLLHGFPVWLAKKMISDLGPEDAHRFFVASNEPAPIYIAVNSTKASDDEIVSTFEDAGCSLSKGSSGGIEPSGCYKLSDRKILSDRRIARLIKLGKIIVSDASAQSIAHLVVDKVVSTQSLRDSLSPTFLELCAGRGTKTILLQSNFSRVLGSQLDDYFTLDNIEFKKKLLVDRVCALGVHVADSFVGDATRLDRSCGKHQFDCVFIDAPCSGLGTLRRHPEIRWRVQPDDIEKFAHVDSLILNSAAQHVKPSGILAYSTCTTTKEECSSAVANFINSDVGSKFELLSIGSHSSFQPHLCLDGPDSHFLSLMQRR